MKSLRENPEFESKHPRVPSGSSEGGEFAKKGHKRFTDLQAKEIVDAYKSDRKMKLAQEILTEKK